MSEDANPILLRSHAFLHPWYLLLVAFYATLGRAIPCCTIKPYNHMCYPWLSGKVTPEVPVPD